MKQLIFSLGLGLCAHASLYAQDTKPVTIDSPVDKIFVPSGFDDNDNVEVILHGTFPDACHRVGETQATVDAVTRTITVRATSVIYPDEFCVQSLTPFIQTVELGLLPQGDYDVVYAKNQSVESTLDVARRKTESPDDYLYAPVANAYIDINAETGKQSLKITGQFPNYFIGCMVIREVRVIKDPVDVLVVQPIAEVVDTDVCDTQAIDLTYEYTVGLTEPFKGEGLIHVRTLNGTSLNRFINIL